MLALVGDDRLPRLLERLGDEHGVPVAARRPRRCRRPTAGIRSSSGRPATWRPRRLRAGRVDDGAVRRQLELARADLVPRQLPGHRGARRASRRGLGDDLTVEFPRGSGQQRTLREITTDLAAAPGRHLPAATATAAPGVRRRRRASARPRWRDALLFHEYFHGDDGAGLGASHQTGWTGLVADMVDPAVARREEQRDERSALGAHVDGDGVRFAVFSGVADAVDALPVRRRRRRGRASRSSPTRATCGAGTSPARATGTRYGFRVHGPWDPAAGRAATRPSCCSTPTRGRSRAACDGIRRCTAGDDRRATRRRTCRAPWSGRRRSTGATTGRPGPRWRTRSSTSCTSRASRRLHPERARDAARHLRRARASGGDRAPAAARRHRRRAAARPPVRPRRARSSRAGCATTGATSRSATSPPTTSTAAAAGQQVARVQGDGPRACTRPGLEVHPRRRLQPHRRGRRATARRCASAASTTPPTTGWPRTAAATSTTPAAATRSTRTARTALRLVMDSLRYWVQEMHVDGFRFDLAASLGRGDQRLRSASARSSRPSARTRCSSRVKLIAEPWDVGHGGYELGDFPPGWSEWNGRYRDTVRDFWRGDGGHARRLRHPPDGLRGPLRRRRPAPDGVDQPGHRPRRLHARRPRQLRRQAQRGQRRGQPRRHRRQPQLELRRRGPDRRPGGARAARAPAPQPARHAAAVARACRCCSAATSSAAPRAATTTPTARTTRSAGSTGHAGDAGPGSSSSRASVASRRASPVLPAAGASSPTARHRMASARRRADERRRLGRALRPRGRGRLAGGRGSCSSTRGGSR